MELQLLILQDMINISENSCETVQILCVTLVTPQDFLVQNKTSCDRNNFIDMSCFLKRAQHFVEFSHINEVRRR